QSEQSIVIVDGRINSIRDGYITKEQLNHIAADSFTTIDLRNKFILPGLIDCHTHITSEYSRDVHVRRIQESDADSAIAGVVYAKRTRLAGFTTMRNVGSSGDAAFALRDAINRGDVPGPRLLCAGHSITPTGGHGDRTNGYREDLLDVPTPRQGVADGV